MRDATLIPEPPLRTRFGARAVRAYLHRCSRLIGRHAAALTRLDAALGDGDHGDNLLIGFAAVDEELAVSATDEIAGLLRRAGMALVASVGGASGPLYGAAFTEAGFAARGMQAIGVAELAGLLDAAAAGLARRGRCSVGDKTIYDTLAPAAEALGAAVERGAAEDECLRAMLEAARRGMRSTTALVARRGLAVRLGDRSRGHRDPGAASCFLLLSAIAAEARRYDGEWPVAEPQRHG